MLSDLEVSKASCCVIDRTGVELPGQRNTVSVTGGGVTDRPTPAHYIWAPIILSDKLLEGETHCQKHLCCTLSVKTITHKWWKKSSDTLVQCKPTPLQVFYSKYLYTSIKLKSFKIFYIDITDASLCLQHFTVVAVHRGAHFKYFIYCWVAQSIAKHHIVCWVWCRIIQ